MWTAATAMAGPVYLDTNIVVGAVVSRHWLYPTAQTVIAEILAQGLPIVVSDLVQYEAHWVLAAEAHALENGMKNGSFKMTMSAWNKNHAFIFGKHSATVSAARDWLKALNASGHPIQTVSSATGAWLSMWDIAFGYMRDFKLAPGDAGHLALAAAHAKTFITADAGFGNVAGVGAPTNIAMLLVRP